MATTSREAVLVPTPTPAPRPSSLRRPITARLAFYAAFAGLWVALSAMFTRIPDPWSVVLLLGRELAAGEVLSNFLTTNVRFLTGVAIAVVVGIVVGLVAGVSSFTRAFFSDAVLIGLSIPAIIWAFLSTMWFGFGWEAPVTTAALATTPYVAVNVMKGLQSVSRDLRDMSGAYQVPTGRQVRHLLLPAVSGFVVAGLRVGLIIGWNGVLLSEWFGASDGVGFRARYWYDGSNYAGFTAWVILFVLYVVIVDRLILLRLARRLLAWREDPARSASASAPG